MKKLLFLSFLIFAVPGFAQGEGPKLDWEGNRKLSWSDFQGDPDPQSPFHANTNSGISFSWSLRTKGDASEFLFEIRSLFYPLESWVKGERSANLLAHEQLHFDISELFARKLRQQLASFNPGADAKQELNRIYQENERKRRLMQEQYDLESQHGVQEEAQAKWEVLVRQELSALGAFSF